MLALDLGVFHRKSHTVSMKEALTWSGVRIALPGCRAASALARRTRNKLLKLPGGTVASGQPLAFLLISLTKAAQYQHKVLFWGIPGAAHVRCSLPPAHADASFTDYLRLWRGAVVSGLKMAFGKTRYIRRKIPARPFRRFMPVTAEYQKAGFREAGQTWLARRCSSC